ncbi:MAG TPA: adenylate/guanylate cyclase domain-containing protein [Dehalococcoidia bacterium]|nr:adenylate/guanylate cyclase domain-containing protein [Dehalococcoidia bacterium]
MEAKTETSPEPAPAAVAERRLVSVLFADLVGFTPLSEDADPEAVREFLGRYFEAASQVIANYGGTVEKFIGDAVMAVWGSPRAHEDDAERAVRAALDLVEAAKHLDSGGLTDDLKLRAGVLTGEAAVTIGAEQQGMVVGDMVNTASRIQSVAPPGCVLVGEATFRATRDAIAFEEAGEHILKGKRLPVPVWRALRVVGKIRGAGRSERLEPPFIGRDEELRLLKQAYHATVRERKARLVSVIGQAGLGKSRLAWEFSKYTDGLAETMLWHEGRSPAYGEGITFWALGEMVRRRAGIAETDDPSTSRSKLTAALKQHVLDLEERRWMEPCLAALLGLGDAPRIEQEELYAAWRGFFERLSENAPVVMVFQDMHWADAGLLDFIDKLLEWAASRPILVLTFARPDLLEKRSEWGAGQKRFTSIHLEPLEHAEMAALLEGLVPGLPSPTVEAIVTRAEGFPMYAVEIVRMLVDQGVLLPESEGYRLAGDVESLTVPESLQSLIAARLDALPAEERALLQNAAVLGQSFTPTALASMAGDPEADIEPMLKTLVRKEFLRQDVDPRSPERGQYQFVQALIREVAYNTLSKKDRRTRHLAAARYFEALGEEELAGILASHYLDAYHMTSEGPEADAAAAQARVALRAAAERALALHSADQALAYIKQALTVTPDPAAQALLWEQGLDAVFAALQWNLGEGYALKAVAHYRAQDDLAGVARVTVRLGAIYLVTGRVLEAISLLEEAVEGLAALGEHEDYVPLLAELARAYMFNEEWQRSIDAADRALTSAERLGLMTVIAEALITKGTSLGDVARSQEALVILRGVLELTQEQGLTSSELRVRNNISFLLALDDPRTSFDIAKAGLELAHRFGRFHMFLEGNSYDGALRVGEWDWALAYAADRVLNAEGERRPFDVALLSPVAAIAAFRGDFVTAERVISTDETALEPSARATLHVVRATVALARGDLDEAYRAAVGVEELTEQPTFVIPSLLIAARALLWQRDAQHVAEIMRNIEGRTTRWRWVQSTKTALHAGLAALEGRETEAAQHYQSAAREFRDTLHLPFDLALCQMEFALFAPEHPDAAAAALEAREIFSGLNSPPLLNRLAAARQPVTAGARASSESQLAPSGAEPTTSLDR